MSEAPAKRYISTQQAAFIGVGAMVGAGIFSLLGAAGEVAGRCRLAVVPARRRHRRAAGLLVRQARRQLPVGRRPARVRQPGLRRRPRRDGGRLADLLAQRHRHGDGRRLVRELRQLGVRRRQRRLGEGLRGRPARDDDRPQRRRLERRRPGPEPRRLRRHRHPGVLRRGDDREHRTGQPRAVDLSAVRRTSCRASR